MMRSLSTITLATMLTTALVGGAAAQNVMGAERAPASTVEVQQQLEQSRHDLEAINQRTMRCEQQRPTEDRTLTGAPQSPGYGPPTIVCAP